MSSFGLHYDGNWKPWKGFKERSNEVRFLFLPDHSSCYMENWLRNGKREASWSGKGHSNGPDERLWQFGLEKCQWKIDRTYWMNMSGKREKNQGWSLFIFIHSFIQHILISTFHSTRSKDWARHRILPQQKWTWSLLTWNLEDSDLINLITGGTIH